MWLKDPVDAFFCQIQGSAQVRLPDGRLKRYAFAARNGHDYTPVGRILIARGLVPKEEMTLDRIRAYIEANPAEGRALMRMNRSYVFFREADLARRRARHRRPGLPLTPGPLDRRRPRAARLRHAVLDRGRLPLSAPAPPIRSAG